MQKALFKPHLRNYSLVAGMLLVLTSTTWAQTSTGSGTSPYSGATFMGPGSSYVGLGVGAADLRRPIGGLDTFGGSGQNAYSLSVGSFFSQHLGVEVGYTDFGSIGRNGGHTKVDGINLSLIGRAPMSNAFNLLGKVGTTYSRTDVSASTPGVATGSERGWDWSYGVGGEWLFHPQLSGVLAYDEHYVKYPGGGKNERISNTSLSLRYRY